LIYEIDGSRLIGLLTIFAFWFGYYQHGYSPYSTNIPENVHEYARTMAFMSIVSCQLFYSLTFRHPVKSIFKMSIFSNKYLIGAIVIGLLLQLIVLAIPVMNNAFKLEMLNARGWMSVIIIGFIPIVFNEIVKAIMRKRVPKPQNT